ncbi:MAG: hypothetical protein EOM64_03770 [Erysipelotrichia bacterium]|nr:hypothetical protein [Erysipelotrichia bacterium]
MKRLAAVAASLSLMLAMPTHVLAVGGNGSPTGNGGGTPATANPVTPAWTTEAGDVANYGAFSTQASNGTWVNVESTGASYWTDTPTIEISSVNKCYADGAVDKIAQAKTIKIWENGTAAAAGTLVALVDITPNDAAKSVLSGKGTITITIQVPGVTANTKGFAIHYGANGNTKLNAYCGEGVMSLAMSGTDWSPVGFYTGGTTRVGVTNTAVK